MSGADYDSPKRQSETADRFNFSQMKNFSSGTEEGIRVPVYLPDTPRFSPIEPQSESMCMSNHPTAVREFIRTNNYQDVADLLGPPHYNRVGKLTVQHYRRARELSWENLEVHGFNTSSVRGDESKPPAGEVFAVITHGEEPLQQVRPDDACRVVPKRSALAMSMMAIQIEADMPTETAFTLIWSDFVPNLL
jgi:hypothetical protein